MAKILDLTLFTDPGMMGREDDRVKLYINVPDNMDEHDLRSYCEHFIALVMKARQIKKEQ